MDQSPNDPRARQAALNLASGGQWDVFADHRRRVSGLLAVGDPGRSRLAVLGAGNANDLDLSLLLSAHREVHLIDLDADALARGAARQGVADHPGLRNTGGIDLVGAIDTIATWAPRSAIAPEALRDLVEGPSLRVAPRLPCPFDLVASTCLLRPLIAEAYHAVGPDHPRFPDLVRAIRTGHLRLLNRLAAPGGTVALITDLAHSAIVPGLADLPDAALPALLPRLSREGRHFHGVAPEELARAVRDEAGGEVEALPPWRWRLHDKVYLVTAFRH